MSKLRVPGVSDKYFYYTASGKGSTMDLTVAFDFKIPVKLDLFKAAIEKALTVYPEFAVRPVIKDGKIFYEDNNSPVAVIRGKERMIYFASDETNGYLFAIVPNEEDDRKIKIAVNHGLSDWVGTMRFMRTIMYYYYITAVSENISREGFDKLGIRLETPAPEVWNTPGNLDPYNVFANKDLEPSYLLAPGNAFDAHPNVYDIRDAKSHFYQLTVNLGQFLGTAKHFKTSFVPLFLGLINNSILETCDIGDKDIVIFLPVDLRRVFNTECTANFSDAIFLRLTKKDILCPPDEQCRIIREMINEQRKPENYAKALYTKAQAVRDFEADPRGVIEISKDYTLKYPEGMTYMVTYLGKLDMPDEINKILDDVRVDAPFGASYFLLSTFKNDMRITSVQHNDENKLMKYVYSIFNKFGFEIEYENRGIFKQNVMDLTKLKKVD